MNAQPRTPAGSSAGGQFAETARLEAQVDLLGGERSAAPDFEFRGYGDYSAVEPYFEDYQRIYQSVIAAGSYPYNDLFRGRIPGVAGSEREDTAIYMLQKLRDIKEMRVQVADFEAEGGVDVGKEFTDRRPHAVRALVNSGFYVGGSGFRRFNDGRLVRTASGALAYLPPRSRTGLVLLFGDVKVIWK